MSEAEKRSTQSGFPVDGSIIHQTVLQLLHLSPVNRRVVSSKPFNTKETHRSLPFRLGTSVKRRCLLLLPVSPLIITCNYETTMTMKLSQLNPRTQNKPALGKLIG